MLVGEQKKHEDLIFFRESGCSEDLMAQDHNPNLQPVPLSMQQEDVAFLFFFF
jgi:hypothetical protein